MYNINILNLLNINYIFIYILVNCFYKCMFRKYSKILFVYFFNKKSNSRDK